MSEQTNNLEREKRRILSDIEIYESMAKMVIRQAKDGDSFHYEPVQIRDDLDILQSKISNVNTELRAYIWELDENKYEDYDDEELGSLEEIVEEQDSAIHRPHYAYPQTPLF